MIKILILKKLVVLSWIPNQDNRNLSPKKGLILTQDNINLNLRKLVSLSLIPTQDNRKLNCRKTVVLSLFTNWASLDKSVLLHNTQFFHGEFPRFLPGLFE